MKIESMSIDLADPKIRANPYPTYALLRQTAPIVMATQPYFGNSWIVTRYEDVLTVLKDQRFVNNRNNLDGNDSKKDQARWWMPRMFQILDDSMIFHDEPEHRRLRNLVHQAFTPQRVKEIGQRIQEIVDNLLLHAEQKYPFELMSLFALPLPLIIISEMMGVPEKDRLRFHRWGSQFLDMSDSNLWQFLMQIPIGYRMLRFFKSLITLRRTHPQDDLLTALVQAEDAGEQLSEKELLSMIFLLLLAGHETTVNLIGNGILALLQHPEELQKLRENPDLIDSAIEELLRYTNPVEQVAPRFAKEEVSFHGRVIPKNSSFTPIVASANWDETIFPKPEKLDIKRNPNKHLALGFGLHYCLGAPLARLEAKIAIQSLIMRYPNLRLALPAEKLQWRSSSALRGLRALPLYLA